VSAPGARVALVTGCSSGIGRATALRLDASGWSVHAGVRTTADAESLAAAGSERLLPLILEVTDSGSIAAAAERIDAGSTAGLGALVNNAGVAYTGPLEFVPLDELRSQLEVNLTGQVAVTQAMIPALRRAGGRIVNITSIGGIVATPFFGPYNASKYGLEAIGDCLRVELRPWGIETITIEPGSIATEIWDSGMAQFDRTEQRMPAEARSLYGRAIKSLRRAAEETGERGIPADRVAAVIERAITAERPRARYRVGRDAHLMATLSRILPDRVWDRVIARIMRLP
jgi:NAD(P)-dependent dehydrogenase (short-subunit alcohol dehydrogenase family)